MPEQLRTVDRKRLVSGPLTRLTTAKMAAVQRSFLAVVGMYRYGFQPEDDGRNRPRPKLLE